MSDKENTSRPEQKVILGVVEPSPSVKISINSQQPATKMQALPPKPKG